MIRSLKLAATTAVTIALLTGVAYAATRTVPVNQPAVALQNPNALTLPGDVESLEQALKNPGSVKYKVLVIDSTDGEDKTAYLDRVAAEWKQPAADTLLLVIFTRDNYDIRFYMGASFRANGVSVDEMLSLVRSRYFAGVRKGDVAGGLVSLMAAVDERMGRGASAGVAPKTTALTVADPFYGGRHTAAGQVAIARDLLNAYLSQYRSESVAVQSRLKEFRFSAGDLNVIEGSDTDTLVFKVKYDVLPATADTDWIAGSGVVGENGWILGKTQFMVVEKDGGVWRLKGLSTTRPTNP